MMTSSNGNIFRVTGHLFGEFTGERWIHRTKASGDVCFHLCQNKRLSKQSWGWWFETPSSSLWRHRNERLRKHATTSTWQMLQGIYGNSNPKQGNMMDPHRYEFCCTVHGDMSRGLFLWTFNISIPLICFDDIQIHFQITWTRFNVKTVCVYIQIPIILIRPSLGPW